MQNINSFSNLTEVLHALNGRHDVSDRPGKRWVIIGKLIYIEDQESMNNCPYASNTYGLHYINGAYIGMLKD